ncbi:MAG: phosphate acyltransferase, partial [Rhodospirillales bacterium]|nr:phosphate acyltransferase [Rhodospirillales bacterium]
MTVAVDGMGGDDAPRMIVEGLDLARRRIDDVCFLLFGDQDKLVPLLNAHPGTKKICEIRHTAEAIAGHDKP